MFKHLILIASVVGFSANASNSSVDILTSLPATQMIVGQLVKDTELSAQNIAPARYGFERLPNWYDSQGSEKIEAVSKHAKVVVSMTSIWEEDPLFVHARAHNISIINVDAGQALTPNGLSVATLNSNKGISPFVWLSTANLMRMTEIIGDDLKRIWPEHDVKLSENQGNLLTELKQLNASQQKQLFEANVDSVIILDKALEDFARANDLYVLDRQFKPSIDWNEQDKAAIAEWHQDEPELWVLTTRAVNKQLLDILPENVSVLRIDPIDRLGRGFNINSPLDRWHLQIPIAE